MASKYTQSVQQTGAGSKKTADVVCSRETTELTSTPRIVNSQRAQCQDMVVPVALPFPGVCVNEKQFRVTWRSIIGGCCWPTTT